MLLFFFLHSSSWESCYYGTEIPLPCMRNLKLDLIFSSFSVRSQNHSYKNSIVFRLARHLCSSTSLVIWTYVCHFVLWPSRFCVSYVVDPVPNCTKQNPLVYRSVPVITLEIELFTVWILLRVQFFYSS